MGKGGKKKNWPGSWKRAALVGGTMTLKGRSVEVAYLVLPLRVRAEPAELEERVNDTLAQAVRTQRPS